jgi:hypothetical protein
MVNNVIGVVNYVIAARPSLLNSVIADTDIGQAADHTPGPSQARHPHPAAVPDHQQATLAPLPAILLPSRDTQAAMSAVGPPTSMSTESDNLREIMLAIGRTASRP